MNQPNVVSRTEWLVARTRLLSKEKELTHLRDDLAAQRRQLPWVKVDKTYVFDGPDGRETLADLFGGRSQLLVKHFMFGPGWQEGCVGCSFEVDHIEAALVHLDQRDVRFVAVSRAPLPEIQVFQQRMGWHFKWLSSFGNDFNYDYHVSFTPDDAARGKVYYNYAMCDFQIDELSGISVFSRDASGDVYHTYGAYGRGAEEVLGTYMLLDLLPKGREENGPNHNLTDWVRHHDRYGNGGYVDTTGRYRLAGRTEPCCGSSEKQA